MTGKNCSLRRSKIGTPYVYGMKGKVMTDRTINFENTYGKWSG
ncbi:MAG: hypothetical protein ACLSG1_07075 [Anaerotignum faecicola]